MILPKILIYNERFSLRDFQVNKEGCNKYLFETLRKCEDVVLESEGDLEGQYLSIFNVAYHLCTDMVRSSLPHIKMEEYIRYIGTEAKGGPKKVEAVLCLTRALTLRHSSSSFRQHMKESVRKHTGEFYDTFFTLLPAIFHDHYPDFSQLSPVLTEEYLQANRNHLDWGKWTHGYSVNDVWNLLETGCSTKEEKLHVLDAIREKAVSDGQENVHDKFLDLYARLHHQDDSNPMADWMEDCSGKRILELEAEISRLKSVLAKHGLSCEDTEEGSELMDASVNDLPASVKTCFRHPNEFVREKVEVIVKEFYTGQSVNLAMIEVVLFDHGQLQRRNAHRAFVNALVEWGILSEDTDVTKVANGISTKLKRPFPTEGYREWDRYYPNDRNLCEQIGRKLPDSMRYNR